LAAAQAARQCGGDEAGASVLAIVPCVVPYVPGRNETTEGGGAGHQRAVFNLFASVGQSESVIHVWANVPHDAGGEVSSL
jgi:hypothetical protein